MNVLWFKRDLRVEDHQPLLEAIKQGPVMPLYILEKELWQQPDMSLRHYLFLEESLLSLQKSLQALGVELIIKVGEAVEVLQEVHERHKIKALFSHQETWNGWTYKRDQSVKSWCRSKKIFWYEYVQNGVVRGLKDRDGFASHWYDEMKKPLLRINTHFETVKEVSEKLPSPQEIGLEGDEIFYRQKGGRSEGLKLLKSFLYERGEHYTKEMSSPVKAFESCSRLSPYIAFGTISLREVFQASEKRAEELSKMPAKMRGHWGSAIRSFSSRLRWHCHFIQKLEDEPRIEFENMHPLYNGLRENDFNEVYFDAWKKGVTGYPMVDACMRALKATGWINFRMRAMLMSFASYHLWLHWRKTALHLAQLFTDYEPGIHYSQVQMQSGTTGINTIRVYNPIKQGFDQDPTGVFIREWIPELAHMEQEFIHTPWVLKDQMNGYPMPIVDEKKARKNALDKIFGLRKNNLEHKKIAEKIVKKHGSRKPRQKSSFHFKEDLNG
jgi:deoxyribodipyrimidine photo-lyase